MGTYGNGDELQKRKKRGSTNNAGRLQAFAKGRETGGAEWSNARPEWIAAIVDKVSSIGGACTFSLSRDGGAYGLRLMLDGDHQQLWFNGDVDLDTELEKVYAVLESMPDK